MTRRAGGAGRRRWWLLAAVAAVVAAGVWPGAACSPGYVIRAGWAEAKILHGRRPIPEVIAEPGTDERTRSQLRLAQAAREFAMDELGLDVGDSYTTYTELDRDTLAMVLSAAHRDRLESRTWWFPVVGRVPYRGFFDFDEAAREQRSLETQGYDTYLRPTSAFSTLGWFSDPVLSTIVRYDEIELVATIIHELSHNHLFVPGQVRFNESYATWVGRVGAAEFFCSLDAGAGARAEGWGEVGDGAGEGGAANVRTLDLCGQARARWEDMQRFSVFLDDLVAELEAVYADSTLGRGGKLGRREEIFLAHRDRFRTRVQPSFRALTFASFASTPLNNATLLSRMRYYHRLPDFAALQRRHKGSLPAAIEFIRAGVEGADDPFSLLPGDAGG